MSAHNLDLPKSPRVKVFRAMEAIVRGNPVFQRAVKPSSFRTWSGSSDDGKEFTVEHAPAMRWTPTNGPESFRTPDMASGDLRIMCEVLTRGTCSDDMANFWWMIERCFYPAMVAGSLSRNEIAFDLQNAGSMTGLVFFDQPAFDPGPDGLFFAGQGQMRIDIRLDLNS